MLIVAVACAAAPAAHAAKCPPASVGGAAVATIAVGGRDVPVKRITFEPGGPLQPPATNRAAGLSSQHRGLNASQGTSVISWHVRYGRGCPGALNPLIKRPVGGTFWVDAKGTRIQYRITDRFVVRKGDYMAEWFRTDGPRRLALFSCADLRDGAFRKTVVILAEPAQHSGGATAPGPAALGADHLRWAEGRSVP